MTLMRPIKVAVDARVLAQTGKGVPRFVVEVVREMVEDRRIEIILFSNRPFHPEYRLSVRTFYDRYWRYLPGSVWLLIRFNVLAKRVGADIVWGPAHVLPLRATSLRSVLTVHDLVHHIMPQSMGWWNRWVAKVLVDRSILNATCVVADSEATKVDIVKYVGRPAGTVEMVHLATHPPSADVVHRSKSGREPSDYLFTLGSIEPRKNIVGLLDCLDLLRCRMPQLQLKLTGGHHWGSSETLARIAASGYCEMLGFVSDGEVAATMAASRAFVMPSHYEGFGLPIVEAVGLAPIIASDIPVFRELGEFIDGICFIDFSDPVRAADHIAAFLATDPPPAHFKAGRELEFRWQRVADRYTAIFEAALESPRR